MSYNNVKYVEPSNDKNKYTQIYLYLSIYLVVIYIYENQINTLYRILLFIYLFVCFILFFFIILMFSNFAICRHSTPWNANTQKLNNLFVREREKKTKQK